MSAAPRDASSGCCTRQSSKATRRLCLVSGLAPRWTSGPPRDRPGARSEEGRRISAAGGGRRGFDGAADPRRLLCRRSRSPAASRCGRTLLSAGSSPRTLGGRRQPCHLLSGPIGSKEGALLATARRASRLVGGAAHPRRDESRCARAARLPPALDSISCGRRARRTRTCERTPKRSWNTSTASASGDTRTVASTRSRECQTSSSSLSSPVSFASSRDAGVVKRRRRKRSRSFRKSRVRATCSVSS